jgi:hypothetical protein
MVALGDPRPDWGLDDAAPEQPVHAKIDTTAVIGDKWAAFRCHQTQLGPNHPFMRVPEPFIQGFIREEWFEQAWPDLKPVRPYTDLFDGLL